MQPPSLPLTPLALSLPASPPLPSNSSRELLTVGHSHHGIRTQQSGSGESSVPAQAVEAELGLSQQLQRIKKRFQDKSSPPAGAREFRLIRKSLEKLYLPLAQAPRIYAVLWLIDQTAKADAFDVNNGFTDAAFPFSLGTLPDALDASIKEQFLQTQEAVMTAGARIENGQHVQAQFGTLGFELQVRLSMDEWIVESEQTEKRYTLLRRDARRNWPNHTLLDEYTTFLKGLRHEHLADFIGSFIDEHWIRANLPSVGILLSPPAEMLLCDHLNIIAQRRSEDLEAQERLTKSFGCLANGLEFLQHHKLRPVATTQTIIVYHKQLKLITGFNDDSYERMVYEGAMSYREPYDNIYAYAWTYSQRSSRSAIRWLGLVFLDILTALRRRSLVIRYHRETESWLRDPHWHIWQALVYKLAERSSVDAMVPLGWIKEMMSESNDPELTITQVADKIRAYPRDGEGSRFCGSCCMNSAVQASENPSTASQLFKIV
ncbi:uncharacterized protein BDR25DRAFT_314502 [Lindgomyces ingoldianus]|uniref:Uncharacterized protein n=1 Tax=Lindgomyces ingoldianus TaxID=673940 RepID=A0ACB6QTR1_9PLEO|nr:uncharacterized protein BDR25DRAFT_314502 [Lindgomyces ingoldianus]KAF2470261.1 hypothetical protein BDR25DRAFT_314502 [Lindgomyces ingoldianus]